VRITGALAALLVLPAMVAAMGGCAGDNALTSSGLTTDDLPQATAGAPAAATTKTADGGFNPFDPPPNGTAGAREVIETPTTAEIMQTGTLPEMAFGRAEAPVTIIKYASLTCPYCRRFHKEVLPKLAIEQGLSFQHSAHLAQAACHV
jgi:protein-disulfide isomerase